jgi:hypothetical protein
MRLRDMTESIAPEGAPTVNRGALRMIAFRQDGRRALELKSRLTKPMKLHVMQCCITFRVRYKTRNTP